MLLAENTQDYLVARCLAGLAELAIASDGPQQAGGYADELLRLAMQGGQTRWPLRRITYAAKRC
jgi:hypothetical protein